MTDFGKLGRGIYFSEQMNTSLKYCSPAQHGLRYLLMCEVVVGKQFETSDLMPERTTAPEGFDSVVANPDSHNFNGDSEVVVYNTNQVRLKYLIELKVEGDNQKNGWEFNSQLLLPGFGGDEVDLASRGKENDLSFGEILWEIFLLNFEVLALIAKNGCLCLPFFQSRTNTDDHQ